MRELLARCFFLTANYANYSKLAQVFSGHRIMRIMLVLVEYRTGFSTASERLNLNWCAVGSADNPRRTKCSLGIESLHTTSTASERLNLNCFWHISESASLRDAIGECRLSTPRLRYACLGLSAEPTAHQLRISLFEAFVDSGQMQHPSPMLRFACLGVVDRADGTPIENKPLRGYSRRIDFTEAFWAMTKSPEGTAADSQGWSEAEPLVVRVIPIIQAPSGRQPIT